MKDEELEEMERILDALKDNEPARRAAEERRNRRWWDRKMRFFDEMLEQIKQENEESRGGTASWFGGSTE